MIIPINCFVVKFCWVVKAVEFLFHNMMNVKCYLGVSEWLCNLNIYSCISHYWNTFWYLQIMINQGTLNFYLTLSKFGVQLTGLYLDGGMGIPILSFTTTHPNFNWVRANNPKMSENMLKKYPHTIGPMPPFLDFPLKIRILDTTLNLIT